MIGIAFDLGRTAFVALDDEPGGDAAERHRRREEERTAGDFLFRLADVRNDQFIRLRGARRVDAGERQRRAHQLQERAAADRVDPLGGVFRKFAVEVLLKLGRLGELFEAAPVLLAAGSAYPRANLAQILCPHVLYSSGRSEDRRYGDQRLAPCTAPHLTHPAHPTDPHTRYRWHTEQFVRCRVSAILYSFINRVPISR